MVLEPSHLQRYSLFGGLLEDQIQKILPLMEHEAYAPGDIILAAGSRNDKIRFILDGRVAVVKDGVLLSELGEGDAFGEMEVLDIMPSEADIHALGSTQVMSISNKALHHIYKTDLAVFAMLIMNLARELSRRIRNMDEKITAESPFVEWG